MQETTYTTDQTEAISAGEQRIAKARSAHGSAVTELIAALESQVVRKTLALYPTAVTLVINTYLGEDVALDWVVLQKCWYCGKLVFSSNNTKEFPS